MHLTSDTSVQCGTTTTYDPWEWEVICLNCVQPSVSAVLVENCFTGSFTVEVTVNSTGDGATVDLESVPGSVEHDDVGASPTPYVMGPYPNTSTVNLFVRHENDATCDLDLGSLHQRLPTHRFHLPVLRGFRGGQLVRTHHLRSGPGVHQHFNGSGRLAELHHGRHRPMVGG
ncbi:MAG: hypothetical protein IPG69_03030 [Flavobacteriales bacterium]|nr:hypothetical protein [Flavobacteriales bacterium]